VMPPLNEVGPDPVDIAHEGPPRPCDRVLFISNLEHLEDLSLLRNRQTSNVLKAKW